MVVWLVVVVIVVMVFLVYVRDVVGQRAAPRAASRAQTMYGTPFLQVF